MRKSLEALKRPTSLILSATLPLGGCSYSYDISAIALHGDVAFIVDPNSSSGANCIRSIHVATDQNIKIAAAPDDDKQLVKNGVVWWIDTDSGECLNSFPVVYGSRIKGRPFAYDGKQEPGVAAKPLQIGVIYYVSTSGSGSGYGSGRFRLRPNRTVENLPRLSNKAVE